MDNVIFAAIDPSISCTAISIIRCVEDRKYEILNKTSLTVKPKTFKDRWDKKVKMLELFTFYLDNFIHDISFCVFENYSYGSPGHLSDLGELNGLYKYYLTKHNKPFDTITPSEVKKIITGKGRAEKKEILESLPQFLTTSVVFNNFDESDSAAVGIAYAIKMIGNI